MGCWVWVIAAMFAGSFAGAVAVYPATKEAYKRGFHDGRKSAGG